MTQNLFLFSSDQRPLYKSDIYDVLGYPDGFIMQFRYRRQHMTEDLWNSNDLCGKEVVICALIKSGPIAYEFVPIRKGKVFKTKKIANVLIIHFELLDQWADLSKDINFDQAIKNLPYRPQLVENRYSGQFITFGDNVNIQFNNEISSWSNIVQKLAGTESYSQGIFYKILEVRNLDNDLAVKITNHKSTISGYQFQSEINYSIDVMIYFGKEPSTGSENFLFKCEGNNSLRIFNNQQRLGFIVDIKRINLNPVGTISKKIAQLKMGISDITTHRELFECPNLEIPVYIEMGKTGWRIIGTVFLGLGILSGGFVGILAQLIPQLDCIVKTYPLVTPVIAILGSIVTALGIWQLNQFRGE